MNQNNLKIDDILIRFPGAYRLGGGSQKEVYLYEDKNLGKIVLKIGLFFTPQTLERIKREVAILCELSSPVFPKHINFEVIDNIRFLIFEEYIDGTPLDDCIHDYTTPEKAFSLLLILLSGLSELWLKRVVHRDLKPANIMVTKDGPRIIDLGIARFLDSTSLTHTFAPFGPCTPNYASPEQLENRKRDIDHRTDQFSLGIVIGQLILDGEHPFDPRITHQGRSIPENILTGNWAKNQIRDKTSPAEYFIITKLLAPQPYMRFRLPNELINAVIKVVRGG
ncbi:MAG: serine/threonine-protein kinase [Candidatus Latescibacter sp.]|nr:serine/threonine-protein kinase [Candidatus Latescibacter sp.]